ncbi:FG-GAP repeat domain-containing protein [Streptomyces sp. NPDC056160]|uniref:FG-GAP repeat domain-containing protein n=1 Tax=Streptomyces sp. NPDC056160 TaxID=3345731 RepID=UPI0035E03D5E
MAKSSGLNTRRAAARVTVAAVTAALVATGTGAAFAADAPGRSASQVSAGAKASGVTKYGVATPSVAAKTNALYGMDSKGDLYGYWPDSTGTLGPRQPTGYGFQDARFITQVDQDKNGESDGIWDVTAGQLSYTKFDTAPVPVGGGWNIYNRVLSTGNLGGAAYDDLLARDSSGVLWLYLGYGNGKLTSRYKVGGGWNAYTDLAGKGDLTGDGKDDIVAKDTSGVLWLYKGTGNSKSPFAARTRIGSGWNTYNTLLSVGDINHDGITDLLARDKNGALWLYKGTGKASAPYASRVKIGSSGWNTYRILY